jgi:hypothetical protein
MQIRAAAASFARRRWNSRGKHTWPVKKLVCGPPFFGFAKSHLPNTWRDYFSTCYIVLALGKQQELANQKCKTVGDALDITQRKVQLRILTATTKYMVHDESNTTCSLTQPNLSKMKLHILGNNVKAQGDKRIGRQRS